MLKIIDAEMRDKQPEDKAVKGRVYFFIKDEKLHENLERRHGRPYNEYRKLLPEVFMKVGFTPIVAQALTSSSKWSQKAGCGCGCSPGFITANLRNGESIFVHVTE